MGLFESLTTMFQSGPALQGTHQQSLATIAKVVDERLVALPESRQLLLPAVDHALSYYSQTIAAIPGPLPVSAELHGSDPVLATLFPTAGEIGQGLGRSIAIRNSLRWYVSNGHQSVHAFLGVRVRQDGSGHAFVDHTFRSLGIDERDSRDSLREAAFEGLVKGFATRLKDRQREWRRVQRGEAETSVNGDASPPDPLDEHIARAGGELGPKHALDALVECLYAPERHLRVESGHEHPPVIPGCGEPIRLPCLAGTDRRKWLVCLAHFPVWEAVQATERESQAHRYILV